MAMSRRRSPADCASRSTPRNRSGRSTRRSLRQTDKQEDQMGRIVVHEFCTLDGVIDNPAWSMEFSFDPKMSCAIARIMQSSKALLMGRNTYELFAPTWSARTADDD